MNSFNLNYYTKYNYILKEINQNQLVKVQYILFVRILFFIDSLTAGGKERRLAQLLKGIHQEREIEFILVIMSKDIHYQEILTLNIDIKYIIRKTKKDLSIVLKLIKICRDYKPDIVHCWDSMTAVYAVPVTKLLGIRLINGMVIDTPVKRNIFNKYWLRGRLTFPFSDVIVGNSKAGLKAYKVPLKKAVCIYNGVDLSRFNNLIDKAVVKKELFGVSAKDIFVIGMVAAFEDRKDYKTLIRTANNLLLSYENIVFLLIGGGKNFQEIKDSVLYSVRDKVVFLGKRYDVESLINTFDVGVLLTNSNIHGEGISNSLIEYMSVNKPVIATKGGGTEELIINGFNGFLIEPGDHDQLVQTIIYLYNIPDSLKIIGDQGRSTINERFTLERMTDNYIKLYKNLIIRNKISVDD